MRCSAIQLSGVSNKNNPAFRGIPLRIEYSNIKNWHDAIKYWELLKNAKYLDVHSDGDYHWYRGIREHNYSFLDKLKSYTDKSEFISRYCDFTGFPNLKSVSDKINSTFNSCIQNIARNKNNNTYGTPFKILDSGYDPTCSIGLKKALPGSDLDKGYIILEGRGTTSADKEIVNEFKGELWNNLDQRIVSLNHPDTFPDVYTKEQIKDRLTKYDKIAGGIVSNTAALGLMAGLGAIVADMFLGPFGVPIGIALGAAASGGDKRKRYIKIKNSSETDPYKAAEFNREFAKKLSTSKEREDAKNFAFFAEIAEENLKNNSYGKNDSVFDRIRESDFVQNSNVTQVGAWQRRINGGYLKSKLRNRENLNYDFNKMSTEERYELIKDIVKYSSDDQSSKFAKYFQNDDNIKDRYQDLLDALR